MLNEQNVVKNLSMIIRRSQTLAVDSSNVKPLRNRFETEGFFIGRAFNTKVSY